MTWHTLRHTFASRLTGGGVDLVTMKELLGHSSIAVTMSRAVRVLTGDSDKVVTIAAGRRTQA